MILRRQFPLLRMPPRQLPLVDLEQFFFIMILLRLRRLLRQVDLERRPLTGQT